MTTERGTLEQKCQSSKLRLDEDEYEGDMTIGIGFHCKDGLLIAGDRQRNKGDSARSVTKVREFGFREGLSGVFVGAGTSSCIEMMFDEINDNLQDYMPLQEIMRIVDRASRTIYEKHVKMPGREKKPRFSMLVGLRSWSGKEPCALISAASDSPARVIDAAYKTIGSGSQVANFLIGSFYPYFAGSCEDAALVSVMAIKAAKDFDPSCGGGTDIIGLLDDGTLVKPKNSRAVASLEDHFLNFLDYLKPMFSHVWGGQDFGSDFDKSAHDLKADLKKFRKEHHQDPLLIRRFPRSFTKSDFAHGLRKVSRRIGKPQRGKS
jgi:hypothetical protein